MRGFFQRILSADSNGRQMGDAVAQEKPLPARHGRQRVEQRSNARPTRPDDSRRTRSQEEAYTSVVEIDRSRRFSVALQTEDLAVSAEHVWHCAPRLNAIDTTVMGCSAGWLRSHLWRRSAGSRFMRKRLVLRSHRSCRRRSGSDISRLRLVTLSAEHAAKDAARVGRRRKRNDARQHQPGSQNDSSWQGFRFHSESPRVEVFPGFTRHQHAARTETHARSLSPKGICHTGRTGELNKESQWNTTP